MAVIAGYTKRPEPKWPYVLAAIVFVVLFFFVLLIFPTPKNLPEEKAAEKPKTKPVAIKEARLKVEPKTLPVSDLRQASLSVKVEDGKIYCYSQLALADLPQTVRHVWLTPNGRDVAAIELKVVRRPQVVWSYVSSYGFPAGTWEVQVKTVDGSILAQKKFELRP